MKGQTKKRKVPGELRKQLAQNLARLIDQRYRESTNRPMALAKDTGLSLSSIQRTLDCQTGATVDTLEIFAKVFGLPPFQLLVPWGLLGELALAAAGAKPAHPLERRPLYRSRNGVRQSRPSRKVR